MTLTARSLFKKTALVIAMGAAFSVQAQEPTLSIGGVVEVEASFGEDDYGGDNSSDIVVSTVEIGLGAEINPMTSAEVVLLYEEDDTELDVDVATITVGNADVSPGYVTAGRTVVPFGNFTSGMLSDPLTLELAETSETAIILGYDRAGFSTAVYAFNGDSEVADKDDTIAYSGVSFGYITGSESSTLDIGVDFISNIADSDAMQGYLEDPDEDSSTNDGVDLDSTVAGTAIHIIYGMGPMLFIAEHVSASDDFEAAELAFKGDGAQPSASNVEFNYGFDMGNMPAGFAVAYRQTAEALALGLPETAVGATLSMEIYDATSLSFEYLTMEDYGTSDNGSGENTNQFTIQLAAEF